jgi:hypothetical protein
MTLRRSIMGLTVLCALVFSAFCAASASAGVTSFTCSEAATVKDFAGADCFPSEPGTKFGHVEWAGTTPIKGEGKETAVLAGSISGVKVKIQCTGSSATGSTTNVAGPPMSNTGKEVVISYTGCTVSEPAGKGCLVKGGAITTNKLATVSVESPLGVKFSPESATNFVEITVEKCSVTALNGTFPVAGTITPAAKGAHLTTTTSSTGLTFAGNAATLVSTTTVKNASSNTALTYTVTAK